MTIKSIMISCVESKYTAEYITDVLWNFHIAKVSSITLIPYLKNNDVFSTAYITIHEWCDREVAYNFIKKLKDPNQEARLNHSDDNWWPVEINTHNDGLLNGARTSKFPLFYFESIYKSVGEEIRDDNNVLWETGVLQGVASHNSNSEEEFNDFVKEQLLMDEYMKRNFHNVTLRDHQKALKI